jgi:two-component system response regulator LytT
VRLVIVEDELVVARRLERMVRAIVGERAESVTVLSTLEDARREIERGAIDILFLDLNLNGKNGFRLLEEVAARPFHTIVVSARHDQALLAFDYGVTDFVAKPWSEERLRLAIARAAGPEPSGGAARRIAVRTGQEVVFVPVDEIAYVSGADDYSELHLAGGGTMLCDKTLAALERLLPERFARVHRSYIANLGCARGLRSIGGRPALVLNDGRTVPVGRLYAKALRAKLGGG